MVNLAVIGKYSYTQKLRMNLMICELNFFRFHRAFNHQIDEHKLIKKLIFSHDFGIESRSADFNLMITTKLSLIFIIGRYQYIFSPARICWSASPILRISCTIFFFIRSNLCLKF